MGSVLLVSFTAGCQTFFLEYLVSGKLPSSCVLGERAVFDLAQLLTKMMVGTCLTSTPNTNPAPGKFSECSTVECSEEFVWAVNHLGRAGQVVNIIETLLMMTWAASKPHHLFPVRAPDQAACSRLLLALVI